MQRFKIFIILVTYLSFFVSCNPDALIPTGTGNQTTIEINKIRDIAFNSATIDITINYPEDQVINLVGVKSNSSNTVTTIINETTNADRKVANVTIPMVNLSPNLDYTVKPYVEIALKSNLKDKVSIPGLEKSFKTKQLYIENGIIKCPEGSPGIVGMLNNKRVEVVDRSLLIKRRDENADLSCLCTSIVTDMTELFADNFPEFNQDITSWDLSNVTSTRDMFRKAYKFNQPIGNWDVSKVEDMAGMFFFAENFNQNLSKWNVSNVKKMHYMFREAKTFNGDISTWNVAKVDNFYSMFLNAWQFNQPIGNWNTKSGVDFGDLFWWARSFNQPLKNWDMGNATNLAGMFNGAISFNQDISNWNVSNVKRMDWTFNNAIIFNQPIGKWDVSQVTTMDNMFNQATNFNQNITNWCVPQIKSQPTNFSTNSSLPAKYKPSWGNCFAPFQTVTSKTGRIWMDRNLGASQVATSPNDENAFGGLYQWGRATDGHEKRNSGTTSQKSESDSPGHNMFITTPDWNDWKITRNDKLWQGVNSINNVCPTGFRLPTQSEWDAEIKTWDSKTSAGAFNSTLKLTTVGMRNFNGAGGVGNTSTYGYYWSSTVIDPGPHYLVFSNVDALTIHNLLNNRAFGLSVRCIQD